MRRSFSPFNPNGSVIGDEESKCSPHRPYLIDAGRGAPLRRPRYRICLLNQSRWPPPLGSCERWLQ